MKSYLLLFVVSLLTSINLSAQIMPHVGWFEEGQLFYNPSYAGLGDQFRGATFQRGQWRGISGSPRTYFLSVDNPMGKGMGLGGSISKDEIGHTIENKLSIDGSYRVYLNSESFFQAGLKGSISNFSSKFSELSQWDDDDPLQTNVSTFIPRIGFGFTFKTPNYHIGISAPDFFSYDTKGVLSDESDNRYMRRNYFFTSGTKFSVTEYVTIVPSVLIRYYEKRGFNCTLNAGLELNQTIHIGISYVYPSIYGIYGKVALTPRLKFGYRHELSPKVISVGTFGTGEFLLTYGFN